MDRSDTIAHYFRYLFMGLAGKSENKQAFVAHPISSALSRPAHIRLTLFFSCSSPVLRMDVNLWKTFRLRKTENGPSLPG